jgi:hypothetical protein
MNEGVERAARAIARLRFGYERSVIMDRDEAWLDGMVDRYFSNFEEDVRAVIEAIREPPTKVLLACYACFNDPDPTSVVIGWNVVIDELLRD